MSKPKAKHSYHTIYQNDNFKDDIKTDNNESCESTINPDFLCPICQQLMRKPVIITGESSKHKFCLKCIESWLNIKKTNPMTNKKLKQKYQLKRDYKIEKDIQKFALDVLKDESNQETEETFEAAKERIREHVNDPAMHQYIMQETQEIISIIKKIASKIKAACVRVIEFILKFCQDYAYVFRQGMRQLNFLPVFNKAEELCILGGKIIGAGLGAIIGAAIGNGAGPIGVVAGLIIGGKFGVVVGEIVGGEIVGAIVGGICGTVYIVYGTIFVAIGSIYQTIQNW